MEKSTASFEGQIAVLLRQEIDNDGAISAEELTELGMRDAETAVEEFLQENMKKIEDDKWLCVLSGKKFKAPEFVRKHIFNKHVEKVDEVKREVR